METGPEMKRQIVLKYRQKLKAALCEHEVKADQASHMILLGQLVKLAEDAVHNTHKDWLEKD